MLTFLRPIPLVLLFAVALPSGIIAEAPPRTDRHGDPLPPGAIARLGTVRWRHSGDVQDAVFSPDGKLIASTCNEKDPAVWLWDAATGRLVRRIEFEREIRLHAFMPDGKALLLAVGGVLALHDLASGRQVRRFPKTEMSLRAVALARDGRCLVYGADEPIVHVCDPASGRELRRIKADEKGILELALAPDGKLLASISRENVLRLWDVASGDYLRTLAGDRTSAVAFSPDGRTLAWGDSVGVIRLMDVPSRRTRKIIRQKRAVSSLTFSPDGSLFLCSSYGMRLWDTATGEERPESKRALIESSHAVFAPDGKTLLLWNICPVLRLWDVEQWCEKPSPEGHRGVVRGLAIAPDGKSLLSTCDYGTIRLWELAPGRQRHCWTQNLETLQSAAYPIVFAPDGQTFAAADEDGIIRIRETNTGRQRVQWRTGESNPIGLAYSPDGRRLIASGDEWMQVWGVAANKRLHRHRHPLVESNRRGFLPAMHQLFFTGSRAYLLFRPEDDLCGLWDMQTGKRLPIFGDGPFVLRTATPSTDGKTLAVCNQSINDETLQLWETTTDQERGRIRVQVAFSDMPAFAPDGRTVAALHADDCIRLWSVITGAEVQRLQTPVPVTAMAFAPDGKALVTAHTDTTILVWDVSAAAARDDFAALPRLDAENAWKALAGPAEKAHAAIWQLTGDPKRSVPLLAERLRPAGAPPSEKIARWIADLDSDDFPTRRRAAAELEKFGDIVAGPLQAALRNRPSLEARRRLEQLLQAAQARQRPLSGELLRSVRAIEVLEHLGTPEAQAILRKLVEGAPEARLTQEARAARARVEGRAP